MKNSVLGVLLVALPALAHSAPLDSALSCGDSPHHFFSELRAHHLIEASPMHVEPNSVNAFWPAHDVRLTAFDHDVFAVFGYQRGDLLFRPGDGSPSDKPLYGVVVVAGEESVRKSLKAAGSKASVEHAAPFLTAIVCEGA
ncbi:hypothetical protein [Cupriavidus sp. IDO]|uniref:hypothetical protein n=1 Tax=Cupriavidus sp. IDO TaxID=1539142 RepID=UPI00057963A0|nr:hypothetical protein [Cupriavidus sp. IDO]